MMSVLTKPSALPALAGLFLAVLLGSRSGIGRRAAAATAVAAGTAAGLAFDDTQARFVHSGLSDFLTSGNNTSFYRDLARSARSHVLLDGSWLGSDLRVLVGYGVLYALARLVLSHRRAVVVSAPTAIAWAWLGPHLAGSSGVRVGILATGGWLEQASVLLLAASLFLALLAPEETIPERIHLARALVWGAAPFLAWAAWATYDVRLLSPAWPALLLLVTWSLLPVFAGARASRTALVAVPVLAALVLGVYAVRDVDGLGPGGWTALRAGGLSGMTDAARRWKVGLGGDFAAEMRALQSQVRPGDRIATDDARLRFFYLQQVDMISPESCDQLQGAQQFVLVESDEEQAIYGDRAGSAFWLACRRPRLTMVAERPGAFAAFVNGTPRPTVGGCDAPPHAPELVVQFGPRFATEAAAQPLLARVVTAGFAQARIEQLGCAWYRVVLAGIPTATIGQQVVQEAQSAKLRALVDSS